MSDTSREDSDPDILSTIGGMVAAEHELRERIASGKADAEQAHQELGSLEVQLDQCWDLLRQRRARREFGQEADGAKVRPASQVESYRS